MNPHTLTQAREALVTALASAGLPVIGYEPDRPSPPQVIIALGSPSLTPGPTWASRHATYRLICTQRPGGPEKVISDLESMLETVTRTLNNLDEVLTWSAGEPFNLITDQTLIPAIEITTTVDIT